MQANNWAIRCVHESKMHEENTFVTLTYAPEHVPKDESLDPQEMLNFLKAVKRQNPGKRIRYLYCGEYTKKGTPHYHALLFGHSFPDQKLLTQRRSKNGQSYKIYTSDLCSRAWQQKGYITIGEVNQHTASYVGKYCFKKLSGAKMVGSKLQPFARMSRRPGIGLDFYKKFKTDIYPSDECRTSTGGIMRPPRYYDEKLREENLPMYNRIKLKREIEGKKLTPTQVGSRIVLLSDNDLVRLKVKEFLATEKTSKKDDRPMEALN